MRRTSENSWGFMALNGRLPEAVCLGRKGQWASAHAGRVDWDNEMELE